MSFSMFDPTHDEDVGMGFAEYISERADRLAEKIRRGPCDLRDEFIRDMCDLPEDRLAWVLMGGDEDPARDWLLERAQRDHNREVRDEA